MANDILDNLDRKVYERIEGNKVPEKSYWQKFKEDYKAVNEATGGDKYPSIMDIPRGVTKAGQNIAKLMTGGYSPDVDLDYVYGQQGSPILEGAGQYGAGMLAGGASIPGQILSNALYAGTQTQPGEENLGGMLPEGRLGGMIEGGIAGGLPFGIFKGAKYLKKGFDYLRPGKSATEYMQNILGKTTTKNIDTTKGNTFQNRQEEIPYLPTAEENIGELGQRMTFAKGSAKNEALIPKKEFMQGREKENIFSPQSLEQPNLEKIGKIFTSDISDFTPVKIKSLERAIKDYYKTGDVDTLVSKGEKLVDHPTGLTDKQVSKLESELPLPQLTKSSYLKNVNKQDYKNNYLKQLHARFENSNSLQDFDKLKQELGREKRNLQDKVKAKTATGQERNSLRDIINNEKLLMKDVNEYSKKLPLELREKYNKFRNLWARNVGKYERIGKTGQALAEEKGIGLTREKVQNLFKGTLTPQKERILEDIGKSGINNIIYNKLLTSPPGDAKALADAIIKARNSGGYSRFISEKDEKFANDLIKRLKYQKLGKYAAGAATGAVTLGGAGSYTAKHAFRHD